MRTIFEKISVLLSFTLIVILFFRFPIFDAYGNFKLSQYIFFSDSGILNLKKMKKINLIYRGYLYASLILFFLKWCSTSNWDRQSLRNRIMRILIKRTLDSVLGISRYDQVSIRVKPPHVDPPRCWKWNFSKINFLNNGRRYVFNPFFSTAFKLYVHMVFWTFLNWIVF